MRNRLLRSQGFFLAYPELELLNGARFSLSVTVDFNLEEDFNFSKNVTRLRKL